MDDDEEKFSGMYENGHWKWSESKDCLEFVSAKKVQDEKILLAATKKPQSGTVHFRDDIEIMEQMRFRRRYQRKIKPGEPEVITLQDVKDLALYTAPINILSPALIDLLHQTTTERFIRALLLYCQYYLQVLDEMNLRMAEGVGKIRTIESDVKESVFSTNLSDLRLLVAKEYSVMLMGGDDITRFHHMGEEKKRKSSTNKDARLSETLLRISIQIIWLALGRRSFNHLELEVHRLFKSDLFNVAEHQLSTGYIEKMCRHEKIVYLGTCLRHDRKPYTRSPVLNELFCRNREIDFRMLGLGTLSCLTLTERLAYMENAISAPEDLLTMCGVTLGIIGMDRNRFDIMLRPLAVDLDRNSKDTKGSSTAGFKRLSSVSTKQSSVICMDRVYPDLILPRENEPLQFPPSFPDMFRAMPNCDFVQRNRWQHRLRNLTKGVKKKRF